MIDDDVEREERTIYTIAIVALAPVVIIAIVVPGPISSPRTIAAVMNGAVHAMRST